MSELNKALLEFQQRFEGVKKERENSFTKSTYANLDDVWNAAQPLLSDLKLVAKDVIEIQGEKTVLTCVICHVDSGEEFKSSVFLNDEQGAQIFGSELSYKKRYLKCTMLNIVENNDDDGNATMPNVTPMITEKQHSQIIDFIEATETDMSKFISYLDNVFKVKDIEQLTIRQASTAINSLKTKLERIKADG